MPYETEERLKSYLDSNQLHREQMCLAVLGLDKRFTDVRPRHPRGGPDGGRDLEAVFRKSQKAFGAIGFINQAADSPAQRKVIKKKFREDLGNALGVEFVPEVFVFFTNINLTIGDKDELTAVAREMGAVECDIFDRERMRIVLDSADGFSIRFQFLRLPMSEAEQASFFARWGDEINSMVTSGFQAVHRTLDHLLFLQEAKGPIEAFTMKFELDREYSGEEIGHFRAFCSIYLNNLPLNILSILFGSTDLSDRGRKNTSPPRSRPGARYGIALGQWKQLFKRKQPRRGEDDEESVERYEPATAGSAVGIEKGKAIFIRYYTNDFIRHEPELPLGAFDRAWVLPMLNASLAKSVRSIHLFSNGYRLLEIQSDQFEIDAESFNANIPVPFTDDELKDPWVRIRPKLGSAIVLDFSSKVPVRLYQSGRAGASG